MKRGRKPTVGPTPRQRQAMRAIHRVTAEAGHPPTIREVAEKLGVAEQSAYELLLALRAKRLVFWRPGARVTPAIALGSRSASSGRRFGVRLG